MSAGTTRRSVRIGDELWQAGLDKARAEGRDVSDVVRLLLTRWVNGTDPLPPTPMGSTLQP